jgi:hypothetical protein
MEAGKEVISSILCTFFLIFMVGLLREKLSLYYFTVSLQFLAKEEQGFAVIFGILVDSCVDGVFLHVLVSFFM